VYDDAGAPAKSEVVELLPVEELDAGTQLEHCVLTADAVDGSVTELDAAFWSNVAPAAAVLAGFAPTILNVNAVRAVAARRDEAVYIEAVTFWIDEIWTPMSAAISAWKLARIAFWPATVRFSHANHATWDWTVREIGGPVGHGRNGAAAESFVGKLGQIPTAKKSGLSCGLLIGGGNCAVKLTPVVGTRLGFTFSPDTMS